MHLWPLCSYFSFDGYFRSEYCYHRGILSYAEELPPYNRDVRQDQTDTSAPRKSRPRRVLWRINPTILVAVAFSTQGSRDIAFIVAILRLPLLEQRPSFWSRFTPRPYHAVLHQWGCSRIFPLQQIQYVLESRPQATTAAMPPKQATLGYVKSAQSTLGWA